MNPERPELSVIIPFYNEAANVGPLVAELRAALAPLGLSLEVLLVNDGSTDATAAALNEAAAVWPAVRVEHFPRNRGQAAALWWGFQNARGTWFAMLDGDGQNDPADIPALVSAQAAADGQVRLVKIGRAHV